MKIPHLLAQISQYLAEAVLRIFSPNQDIYPLIGTHAFSGDPYKKSSSSW